MNKKTKMYLGIAALVVIVMALGLVATPSFLKPFVDPVSKLLGGGASLAVTPGAGDSATPSSEKQLVVDSLVLRMTEEFSDSPTAANGGFIRIYSEGTNPKDA